MPFFLSALWLLLSAHDVRSQEETDNYLWLEQVEDEKALNWAKKASESTLALLKAQPEFEEIYHKALEVLTSQKSIAYPQFRGNYSYNYWKDQKYESGIRRRTSLEQYAKDSPEWDILLDIDKLCRDENEQWVFKGAAGLYPQYSRYVVYLSRGGSDAKVGREFDLNTRKFIQQGFNFPQAKGSLSWKDANTVYIQTDFGEGSLTDSGYPRITKTWKRGTPLSQAQTIFQGEPTDVSVHAYVINTPERQYEVITRSITFYTSHVYLIENGKPLKLEIPEDADFGGFFKNQLLVLLKSDWTRGPKTHKQGSLISIDYDHYLQGDRNFIAVVEPDDRSNIISFSNTQNLLLVVMLNNVQTELYKYRFADGRWKKEKVDVPQQGTLSVVSVDENSDQYFLSYKGFLTPTSLYHVVQGQKMKKLKSLPEFFNAKGLQVKQLETTSKDGTLIPYFLVHPREMKMDGSNPTLLYGYGGFEISMIPRYSGVLGTAWLEKGGVYVLANIRGGGEFGPKWHQAALKENRQRAYDDFIAVAEDLIKRKITSPRHLGIKGGSNGGLLVGAVMTQRPELFNAVLCQVPLLDMKRYNKLLAGASWMAEFGNPDIPEEWAYIKKYSPYHNLSPDKKYPQAFFYTSTRDDRVHPGHARKMVAKMQDMGHKVYYYENTEGGHAGSITNKQRARETALSYTYLWMKLK
ncbi:MAG: S9 family peptidase [Planctomycetes bacterium]|nr:S9 family peptidase [Planctomycetota bacterium]